MTTKGIIRNIKAWNDLYFKNCYYSALFPVILQFKKSITPVLLNDIYTYKEGDDSTQGFISMEHQSIKEMDDILKDMGINSQVKSTTNVIQELKNSIDANRPVLLFIDCFYEKIRFDAYNKHHWVHIVLVYGYDDEIQAFDILEHKYATGFTYDEFKFSYEDAQNCYEGYLRNLSRTDFTGYIEYSLDPEFKDREYTPDDEKNNIASFIDTITSRKTDIFEGIATLRTFADNFEDRVLNNNLFSDKNMVEKINQQLNHFRVSKSVERYRLLKVFGEGNPAAALADELLEHWGYIAGVFGKCGNSEKLNKAYSDSITKKVKNLPELEERYFTSLFQVLEEWRVKTCD
ncbi:hypothetical protein Back11_19410 [Paenibacillus baekrokdamisoli]|uniref:Butirosin biosynthesis protein H N-terminal domain-containing protein n=1 Tax=Paenibacillus baekrokdamisoli TaxID=1712516 RepID=A0A3G9IQE4_9BACL|nr:BtrH N-terminal domain-containing protein [Paenibacillus baekrokdamisoli]MBB3070056.1 hypothetical protein [Paenibacillus baekrokdamisoli]BBH20596.1 hypothetical protein Back11_19410 [Paenibacillus baekrokdamisoli]